jgi:hypothetical protein
MTKAKPNSPGIDEDSTLHEEVLNSCITLFLDHQQNKERRTNKKHTHTDSRGSSDVQNSGLLFLSLSLSILQML